MVETSFHNFSMQQEMLDSE